MSEKPTAPDPEVDAPEAPKSDTAPLVPDEEDAGTDQGQPRDPQAGDSRYRVRLRDAQARADALAADVERLTAALRPYQRAAIEDAVAEHLPFDRTALWAVADLDRDFSALLGDDLSVDKEKVTAEIERLIANMPTLARRFQGSADSGVRGSSPQVSRGDKWQALLQGGQRG